jgi:serine/threonine protein phosphatase PrpC
MKYFSILEPASEKFRGYIYPQEDFLLVSEKYPIFAVADGVTLIQFLIEKKEYPNPSPAGDVARVFCEEIVKAAEARYESFEEFDIKEIFRIANKAVGEYNNQKDNLYSATAALVIIKNNKAYWCSICDSYVIHFDKNGNTKFKSQECRPYVVVNGEEKANELLNYGSFEVKEGELVALFTDGFENYFKIPEFISLFQKWPADLESQVKKFTAAKTDEDPEKFGHERSLIMISCYGTK